MDSNAYYQKGVLLGNLGNFKAAIASFDKALEFRPDCTEALRGKSVAFYGWKRFQEAIDSAGKCFELNLKDPETYITMAMSLKQLLRYAEALSCLEEGLRQNQNDVLLLCGKGDILYQMGEFEAALSSWIAANTFLTAQGSSVENF
jgi:tetratricopeptide (TPR) repeat protein